MVCISGEVPTPIKPTIIIPNRKNILTPSHYWFHLLSEHFSHQCDEVLSGVAVNSDDFVAFLHREFLHHSLDHTVGVLVELLEIVAEVSHYVGTLQDPL